MSRKSFREFLSPRDIAANCEAWLRRKYGRSELSQRRVLFIDTLLPLPWYGAGHSRAHAIMHALNDNGWSITCFSIEKNNVSMPVIRTDIPTSVKVVRRGRATKFKRLLFGSTTTLARFLIGKVFAYDVVLVSRFAAIKMTGGPLKWLKATNKNCKVVFDFEALPALGERSRQALGTGGPRGTAETRIREQIAEVSWVDAVICNSAGDAHELRRLGRPDAISVSYLADPTPTASDFSKRRDFLFVGRLMEEGTPNVDGLVWFVNEVWPSVAAQLGSDVRLLVAGHASEWILRALQSDSVQFLGAVPNLRSVYDQARVFVAANRVSYGVPIKVLEAAAHGVPVVTTDEVNSYLGWRSGVDILCSDESPAFAQACIRLYEDPTLWHKIRAEALNRIDQHGERRKFLSLMNGLTTRSHDCH